MCSFLFRLPVPTSYQGKTSLSISNLGQLSLVLPCALFFTLISPRAWLWCHRCSDLPAQFLLSRSVPFQLPSPSATNHCVFPVDWFPVIGPGHLQAARDTSHELALSSTNTERTIPRRQHHTETNSQHTPFTMRLFRFLLLCTFLIYLCALFYSSSSEWFIAFFSCQNMGP